MHIYREKQWAIIIITHAGIRNINDTFIDITMSIPLGYTGSFLFVITIILMHGKN